MPKSDKSVILTSCFHAVHIADCISVNSVTLASEYDDCMIERKNALTCKIEDVAHSRNATLAYPHCIDY